MTESYYFGHELPWTNIYIYIVVSSIFREQSKISSVQLFDATYYTYEYIPLQP